MATDILPNCGPTALSFITGQPVNELMEAYRNHFGYTNMRKEKAQQHFGQGTGV